MIKSPCARIILRLAAICILFVAATGHTSEVGVSLNAIPVCYDFGCKRQATVSLSNDEWKSVAGWFNPVATDARSERQQIRHAIGWMEAVIGTHTPTSNDVGQNLSEDAQFPGQLDCIDESRNTTTYLKLFEQHGLLQWHRVTERAHRKSLFDQHWSGQIEDNSTGKRYVVDSWFHPNGYLPYVQNADEWVKVPWFTSYVDNYIETE
jgi:hypothetical protein